MKKADKFLKRVYPEREYPLILTFEKVAFSEKFIIENDFKILPQSLMSPCIFFNLTKVINNKEDLYEISQKLTKELETLFKPLEGLSHGDIERSLYEIVLVSAVINELITRLMLYTY